MAVKPGRTEQHRWHRLQREILRCTRCREEGYREVLCPTTRRPPVAPRRVRLLFVSYAPPAGGAYFYDESRADGLRLRLFRVLEEIGAPCRSIEDFAGRGMFTVPAVKCPSSREGLDAHPRMSVARLCASKHLLRELALVRPERICLLGVVPVQVFSGLFEPLSDWGGRALKSLRRDVRELDCFRRAVPVLPSYWPRERSFGNQYLAEDVGRVWGNHFR